MRKEVGWPTEYKVGGAGGWGGGGGGGHSGKPQVKGRKSETER